MWSSLAMSPRWSLAPVLLVLCHGTGCSPCGRNEVQRDGQCVKPCNAQVDCNGREVCQDGVCVLDNGGSSSGGVGTSAVSSSSRPGGTSQGASSSSSGQGGLTSSSLGSSLGTSSSLGSSSASETPSSLAGSGTSGSSASAGSGIPSSSSEAQGSSSLDTGSSGAGASSSQGAGSSGSGAASSSGSGPVPFILSNTTTLGPSATLVTETLGQTVDMNQAFLVFGSQATDLRPPCSSISGYLLAADAVRFQRTSGGCTGDVMITWYVVQIPGAQVERGSIPMTTITSATRPLSRVANVFPLISARTGGSRLGGDDLLSARLDGQNILVEAAQGTLNAVVEWQTVQLPGATVAQGTQVMLPQETSVEVQVAGLPERTWVVTTYREDDWYGYPTSATAGLLHTEVALGPAQNTRVTWRRQGPGSPGIEGLGTVTLEYAVVTLPAGMSAQHGLMSFTSQDTQSASITLDATHAVAVGGYHQKGGSHEAFTNNQNGGWMRMELSPGQISAFRGMGDGANTGRSTLGWSVIQFW